MQGYFTVGGQGVGEYEEKRSKFIGVCVPVTTEKQAMDYIAKVKKDNFGAKHNVYAYVLREGGLARYSDDSEPHSTAGLPTLEVIKGNNLTDCLIVTTRYFGGVLLGTGGLVRAYTAAAKAAVDAAGIVEMRVCNICKVSFEYSDRDRFVSILEANGAKLLDTVYTSNIEILFSVSEEKTDDLFAKITDTFCGKITAKIVKSEFSAV